jgi:hypothetical protein
MAKFRKDLNMKCKNCHRPIYWDHNDLIWRHIMGAIPEVIRCGNYSDDKYAEPTIAGKKVICKNCKDNLFDSHGTWAHERTGSIHCYFGTYAEPDYYKDHWTDANGFVEDIEMKYIKPKLIYLGPGTYYHAYWLYIE